MESSEFCHSFSSELARIVDHVLVSIDNRPCQTSHHISGDPAELLSPLLIHRTICRSILLVGRSSPSWKSLPEPTLMTSSWQQYHPHLVLMHVIVQPYLGQNAVSGDHRCWAAHSQPSWLVSAYVTSDLVSVPTSQWQWLEYLSVSKDFLSLLNSRK
jgi:hypothetical protein